MNFIKTFLAGLLAFVVGSVVVFFLWLFAILGIVGSLTMEKSVAVLPESVLKIDFSELLTDSPSTNPLAGIDFTTMETTPQLPLSEHCAPSRRLHPIPASRASTCA